MKGKYPKEVFQQKMRAYLDVLHMELQAIEDYLEREDTAIALDKPEAIINEAAKINNHADRLQSAVEDNDKIHWEAIRANLQQAFNDLLEVICFLEQNIDGMKPRRNMINQQPMKQPIYMHSL